MANLSLRNGALGKQNATHLLRRTTYKPSKSLITNFENLSTQDAVDTLFLNQSFTIQAPLAFDTNQYWIPTINNQNPQPTNMNFDLPHISVTGWWLKEAEMDNSIRHKLSFFLHSIFIINTQEEVVNPLFSYDYLSLLHHYSTGSIKQLAKKISRLNAMHIYLNNNQNVVGLPNENYAREFLELFTIGKGPQDGAGSYTNYTEHDVQQAARILTGFQNIEINERLNYIDPNVNIPLGKKIVANHDLGNKVFSIKFGSQTIVGATNSSEMDVELDAFIDMVFAQPETAKNYARRLYRYFVRRNIDLEIETDIIIPLANNLLLTDYDLTSTTKILLKSVHFYDEDDSTTGDEIIGNKIKSPLELALIMNNQFKINSPNPNSSASDCYLDFYYNYIWRRCQLCGMLVFDSLSVAGYPGYYENPFYDKLWINSGNIKNRYNSFIETLLIGITSNNTFTKFNVVDYVRNSGDYSNPSNAITLIDEFLELCFCSMPTGDRYNYFKQALLGNLSIINWQHEWNNYITTGNDSSVKVALERFVKAVVQSPEYQLF